MPERTCPRSCGHDCAFFNFPGGQSSDRNISGNTPTAYTRYAIKIMELWTDDLIVFCPVLAYGPDWRATCDPKSSMGTQSLDWMR
jgi:hypothetical protein